MFFSLSRSSQTSSDVNDFKSKRISHISSCSSSLGGPGESSTTTTPPPLPERVDSLAAAASSVAAAMASEEGELRAAPWFQAGIPRLVEIMSELKHNLGLISKIYRELGGQCCIINITYIMEFIFYL